MYELVTVTDNDFYIESPTKVGLVRVSEDEVVAIDSGNDKDAAKKMLKILEEKSWHLRAIYNTHAHADHIGGNRLASERTGCHIYARGIERDIAAHTVIGPATLFGAHPNKDMYGKLLYAQPSPAEELTDSVLPEGMEVIDLPGHAFDMVGFRTADDTVYLADALSSEVTIEKYGISFLRDVEAYLATLSRIKDMKAAYFVPAHAPATENIAPLADVNICAVLDTAEAIRELCREGEQADELIGKLFDRYKLSMSLQQYVLVGSTVRSYLSYLYDRGEVEAVVRDNRLYWKTV